MSLKEVSEDEIFNLVKILKERSISIDYAAGDVIDVCGTGGDGLNSLNISTAVAFVVAASGVKVAKHGNRAVSSKSGSSDVLTALGIDINISKEKAESCLKDVGISFLFAPNYHPTLIDMAPIRQKLKVRTIFNLLGPLLNPLNLRHQLIGVCQKELLEIYANVANRFGYQNLIVVNSEDGLDEISISAATNICELKSDEIKNYQIEPEDFGFNKHDINEIKGGDAEYNAKKMLALFNGEESAYKDIVLLNAAFALYSSGKYADINQSLEIVRSALESGKVLDKFNQMKDY